MVVKVMLIAAAMLLPSAFAFASETGDLGKIEAAIKAEYSSIAHLSATEFASAIARGEDLVIFDVREEQEYAVSRIAGARRVDPGAWGWQFLRDHGADLADKTVVFYCSVGVRSSKLAHRVAEALRERGVKGVYNLEGGLFRWHNEGRGLVDVLGDTDRVHPFDQTWGRLVDRQDRVSILPRLSDDQQTTR